MLTGWRLSLSKMFCIPQRYVLGIMGFIAILNTYTMRVSLSIAITEMTVSSNESTAGQDDTCPIQETNSTNGGHISNGDVYDWDSVTQGLILSSFYWGYVLTHLPGGMLAEKIGGKYTLGLGILSTAFFTLITPLVIRATNGDWIVLVVLRVLVGCGEGTTIPSLNAMLSKWVPKAERSKIGTMVFAGAQIGNILSNSVGGILISATNNWDSVFYLFGGLSVVWFFFFILLCYDNPESHPYISDKEKMFLTEELGAVSQERTVIPLKNILTSVPVLALVMAQIGHDWAYFTMVTDLPLYMDNILRFEVKENGLLSSLPYLVMWIVSMISGVLCDYLINKGFMSITFARKFFTSIASVGPTCFIMAASYTGCDRYLTVGMFTIAMGLMGTFYCGMKVNALDLTTNYAGTVMAVVNGLGAVSGIITPYLVGALTPNHTLTEWRTVFWIVFGVVNFANIIFCIYGSGETQWWNKPGASKNQKLDIEAKKEENTKENTKSKSDH